ncbi:primosomal protein DnaI [Paenibacillus yanchengensis]|uniref:Primosomal protein DnaI n=1 Tax=Paenibacillus yanchengensis TaxID=2035833 RepID=A0ABW4YPR6_9BACL
MDSLGNMLQGWKQGQSMMEQAEQKMKALAEEPLIKQLRAKHPQINDTILKLHMNKLYQHVSEYRNCSHCPGLDLCPNDYEGHYTMLYVDESQAQVQINDRKIACKKFNARQKEEHIRSRIHSFYIDEKSLKKRYSIEEILDNDPERVKAVGQVMRYIHKVKEEGLSAHGLYLAGPFGTGKTFLMGYMMHELAEAGYSGVIIYMPDFVEDLKLLMHDAIKLKETIDMLKETDVLVFDDIGAENLSPWVRDHIIGTILNYRMERKPTFYTSNYHMAELERHFSFTNRDGDEQHKGQRLMNRIAPYVEMVIVAGSNKRGMPDLGNEEVGE